MVALTPDPVLVFLAAVTIVSAILALESRQIVYGAVSLVVVFIGVSALFLYLGGLYLGVVQLGVYVGAIAVLILFAVILVGESRTPEPNINRIIGLTATIIVLGSLLVGIEALQAMASLAYPAAPPISSLAKTLVENYSLVLVLLSGLLASAAIGSVIITRRVRRE